MNQESLLVDTNAESISKREQSIRVKNYRKTRNNEWVTSFNFCIDCNQKLLFWFKTSLIDC